jgi:L-malate glycosyltransferase
MRVAIVIDSLNRGGAEHQALNAVLQLTRCGIDAELIHYHAHRPGLDGYDHPALREAKVTFLPKNGRPLRFLRQLRSYLRARRCDVVHGFKEASAIYACPAGWMAGTPAVLGGCRGQYQEKGLTRLCHRTVNRISSGWIVNSQAIADSLVQRLGARCDRIFVVYNGLDAGVFVSSLSPAEARRRLGLPVDSETVSILARLRPEKNHVMFLEMAACLLNRRPGVRFLIIGDGELRPALEGRAASLGITNSVLFLGNRDDVRDILAATDLSVLTSPFEGLSNALLESMAAGKPIVTTDYPGVDELVATGEFGIVTPVGNAEAMALAVENLLDDADRRKRMSQQARATVVQRFSVEAMGARLIEVYQQCLARCGCIGGGSSTDSNGRPIEGRSL